jgi:general secretion pathway protein I
MDGTRPRKRIARVHRERGFTLLEVIVALGIVSLVIIAIFEQMALTTRTATALREAALASWVGQNQIAEFRLGETFPEVSEFNGEVEYANTRWRWQAVVSETGVEDLRRVDVDVALAERPDNVIRSVSGFLTPPAQAATSGGWPDGAGAVQGTPEDPRATPGQPGQPVNPGDPGADPGRVPGEDGEPAEDES